MKGIYMIDGVDFAKYHPAIDWSGASFNEYPEVADLKNRTGIYAFTLCGEAVYIGSSINLFSRLQAHIMHMQGTANRTHSKLVWRKYYYLKKYLDEVQFHVLAVYDNPISKDLLEQYEYEYIEKYLPIFNVNYKDSLKRWNGTEQDIADFVNGLISIDVLKAQLINTTK